MVDLEGLDTRRNRAALQAAIENLRLWSRGRGGERGADYAYTAVVDACDALALVGTEAAEEIGLAIPRERRHRGHLIGDPRLLRARLALLLRALIRVLADDWPKTRWLQCMYCGRDHGWPATSQMVCVPYPRGARSECQGTLTVRWRRETRVAPLWESAPPHEVAP